MSALLTPRAVAAAAAQQNGQQVVLYDIPWRAYQTICDALPERCIRMTFDRGTLEIMTVSGRHEHYKSLFGILIYILAEELNRMIACFGSFTHRRKDLERALEPDQCFYIANYRRVLGKGDIDLLNDPPPDLAVEIEISRSLLDRLAILAALGVPEVWRFDGKTLLVLILQEGQYVDSESSPSFPEIDVAKLVRYLHIGIEQGDLAMGRALRTWLRRQLRRKQAQKNSKLHRRDVE